MSSALGPLTMVVLWLAYSVASARNSSGPRLNRFVSDFKASVRRAGYKYKDGIGGYKYFPSGATWGEARKMCQQNDSDLAIINSEREAYIVADLIYDYHERDGSFPENVWIGTFIPAKDQGEWQTIFGDTLAEAGWDKWLHAPDDSTYQSCGAILIDGQLNWSNCEYSFGFVCEVPDIPPTAYKVHTLAMNWADARKACRLEGGDLALINSVDEALSISGVFEEASVNEADELRQSDDPENIWIGMLNPTIGQGGWQTIYGDSLAEAGFDTWHEKPNPLAYGYCGSIFRDGTLTRKECWRKLAFACEGPYPNAHAPGSKDEIGIVAYQSRWRSADCG